MKTLLIDGNYLAYQSYHALPALESEDGLPSGVVFGFLSRCLDLGHRFETNDLMFCWDSPQSIRRTELFPEYKAKRRELSEDEIAARQVLYKQMKDLKQSLLPDIGWTNQFEQGGLEADDMLAAAAMSLDTNAIIVTADEDLFQCINGKRVCIYNSNKHKLWNETIFEQEYGIKPSEWVAVKQIAGCSSDGIPGVTGVGEKTAIKFLRNELRQGKKLDAINAFCKTDAFHLNHRLVKLPHGRTEALWFADNEFSMRGLDRIIEQYSLLSFRDGRQYARWENLRAGRFEGPAINTAGSYNRTDRGKAVEKMRRRHKVRKGLLL